MKVLLGSTNPGKIKGVEQTFKKYYENVEVLGVKVESNVPDQPVNAETFEGTKNRVNNLTTYARLSNMNVDFFVGVESGLIEIFNQWFIVEIAVIRDKYGKESIGLSAATPVPSKYVEPMIEKTMYKVMTQDLGATFTSEESGTGWLTRNAITRIDLTQQALIMALTKFLNKQWND